MSSGRAPLQEERVRVRLARFPCEQGSRSDRVVRGAGGDLDARATSSLMFAAPTGRSVAGRDGFAAWQERRPFYAGSGAQTRGTSPGVVERTRCSTLRGSQRDVTPGEHVRARRSPAAGSRPEPRGKGRSSPAARLLASRPCPCPTYVPMVSARLTPEAVAACISV